MKNTRTLLLAIFIIPFLACHDSINDPCSEKNEVVSCTEAADTKTINVQCFIPNQPHDYWALVEVFIPEEYSENNSKINISASDTSLITLFETGSNCSDNFTLTLSNSELWKKSLNKYWSPKYSNARVNCSYITPNIFVFAIKSIGDETSIMDQDSFISFLSPIDSYSESLMVAISAGLFPIYNTTSIFDTEISEVHKIESKTDGHLLTYEHKEVSRSSSDTCYIHHHIRTTLIDQNALAKTVHDTVVSIKSGQHFLGLCEACTILEEPEG